MNILFTFKVPLECYSKPNSLTIGQLQRLQKVALSNAPVKKPPSPKKPIPEQYLISNKLDYMPEFLEGYEVSISSFISLK